MAGAKWDTPMTKKGGLQEFPGETSGPGVYNDNPLLQKKTSGGFQMKFQETVPRGKEIEFDSPMEKATPESVDVKPAKHSASDNAGAKWDSPFVKGRMKG